MAEWGHKTRFSIAAFRSLSELDAAVSALVAAGFSDDQIGLAATETSIIEFKSNIGANGAVNGGRRVNEAVSAVLDALVRRFKASAYRVAGAKIMVSEGATGQFAGCFSTNEDELPLQSPLAGSRSKLLAQLYSGAWLLGANALSYEQLRAGTRILLAHSSDRVETFELHGF